jgi:hypothetical protein
MAILTIDINDQLMEELDEMIEFHCYDKGKYLEKIISRHIEILTSKYQREKQRVEKSRWSRGRQI